MSDVYVALLRDVFFVGSTFFEYHYLDDNKLIRWNTFNELNIQKKKVSEYILTISSV